MSGFGESRSGGGFGGKKKPAQRRNGPKKKKSWLPPTEDKDGNPIELTDAQRTRLAKKSMDLCVWHLNLGMRTRKQLADALAQKDVPADITETTLNRLEEIGYLNDAQYAETFVRSRHENQRKGSRRISQDLRRKGIDAELIETAMEQIDPEDEVENARALVAKKLRATQGLDRNKRIKRLADMLARNGYPGSVAFQVVREALDAEGDPDEDVEPLD